MSDPLNPIPIVRQAEEDRQVILARVNAREQEAARYTFQHAKDQGEDLLKLKDQAGHGAWTRWAAKNLPIGLRQAQNYLRVWKRFKNEVTSFLTLQEALDFINQEDEDEEEEPAPSQPSANGAAPTQQAEPEKSPESTPAEAEPEPLSAPALSLEDRMKEWNLLMERWARETVKERMDALPEGAWLDENTVEIIKSELKAAADNARVQKAYAICPLCDGKGCKRCRQTGWMTRIQFDSCGGRKS
jgi:hypothetical protein